MTKTAIRIAGALVLIATLLGTYSLVVANVATKAEVTAVSERLDNKILSDRLAALQERLWQLQDRHSEQFFHAHLRYPVTMDELYAWLEPEARAQLRDIEARIAELVEQLNRKA